MGMSSLGFDWILFLWFFWQSEELKAEGNNQDVVFRWLLILVLWLYLLKFVIVFTKVQKDVYPGFVGLLLPPLSPASPPSSLPSTTSPPSLSPSPTSPPSSSL